MIEELAKIITNVNRCAVLTGAGISAESGVPTFRGQEGLWGKFKPEELATMEAFMANPKLVWEWYNWRRELISEVLPNAGHFALTEMGSYFQDFSLITQNVDGLHIQAGSKELLELHGSIMRNKCVKCEQPYSSEADINPDSIPACTHCGGNIRPDIVWFGEMLDEEIIAKAFEAAEKCELFISIGTSALVQPAASLPLVAKQHGAKLVEINIEETPLTPEADLFFSAKSGELLPALIEMLEDKAVDKTKGCNQIG